MTLAEENLDRVMTLASVADLSLMGYFMQRWVTVMLMVLTIATILFSFLRDVKLRRAPSMAPGDG